MAPAGIAFSIAISRPRGPRRRRLAMSTEHYDVIIIGSGAGGGTLAYRLAPSGKRILILERGDWLPREPENWSTAAVFGDNRYKAHETWHDRDGNPFQPGIHYWVGGNTKMYGAVLLRLRERDFEAVRHADGLSPAWPLSYRDLAPYYTEAERLYHVHGRRGGDPTEPPCHEPYPYPAVSHEPRIQQLADDLERAGHHPFPLPVGIMLDEQRMEDSHCIRCSTCDGFPCLVQAKADAHVVAVRPALRHPNVTLLTNAYVERIETSATGREAQSVAVRRNGETERYRADIVVVACGAINSAALLLRSANATHPDPLSEDLRAQRFLHRLEGRGFPARPHPDARQDRCSDVPRRKPSVAAGLCRGQACQPCARFLADLGGSAGSWEPGVAQSRRRHSPPLHAEQPQTARKVDQETPPSARPYRLPAPFAAAKRLFRKAPADRRDRPSEWHDPLRPRSGKLGPRCELPGA